MPTRDDIEESQTLSTGIDYEMGGPDTMMDDREDDGKVSAPFNTNDYWADYIMQVYRNL